ncbi:type II and III secretion system protein family protein, partial [Phenylobacterium sp.]|uniref:type II and III secretion system protein family protein n=1 Tax=Phenylobacterium sp. TaxID=1871053 RepID=UPI002ED8F759
IACCLVFGGGQAAFAQGPVAGASSETVEIVVPVGKSQVIELPAPYSDLMIAEPKVADVLPLTSRSVYVVGRSIGSTSLTIYGPGKRMIAAANIVVSADGDGLKARLHDIMPTERDISVHAANQSLVLSGVVSSPAALQKALALAESYAPQKVVNMLGVEGTQQIMLSVRFVEMQRTTAKNLKLNVNRLPTNSDPSITVFTGDTNVKNNGFLVDSFGAASAVFNGNLELLMDALETKGLIKTLAEPNLVAMSGDTASFLAGGEFPIPVAQSSGNDEGDVPTISIEYKQFGVALAFTPTLLSDGLINVAVKPEVSSIDPTISIDLGSIRIPGIKVRRANTTIELRDGESFTIAGLLKEEYENQVRQFPFVGEIPILGALFRSNGYRRDETELVIVVTPHLVTPRRGQIATPGDSFVPPSDFELFLFGSMQGKSRVRPEDRALISADPKKVGLEGPHGHVLY